MYGQLYENQEAWSTSKDPTSLLNDYAKSLGLNVDQFKNDMKSSSVADTINADLSAGKKAGVESTPTFILNGKKLDKSPTSLDEFKKLIDEEIAKQNKPQN